MPSRRSDEDAADRRGGRRRHGSSEPVGWLEVEDIDPDTGELLGTHRQPVDATGEPTGEPLPDAPFAPPFQPAFQRRPQTVRIGIVVPLSSLLGLSHTPGELADRSAMMPADQIRAPDRRHPRTTTRDGQDPRDQILFTRLLTDDGGRLLDTTELGRYPSRRLAEAIRLRAGTCCHPHLHRARRPVRHRPPPTRTPTGPPPATTCDPACRRHHRGSTFAWQAAVRDHDGVDWTMPDAERYRCTDEPLPGRLDPGVEIGRTVSRSGRRCRSRGRSARGA